MNDPGSTAAGASPLTLTDPAPAARLAAIYRYPVKGLSAEALTTVKLEAGETLPFDRAYAIENGQGRFDPFHPRHVPKTAFLTLMRDAALASVATRFDPVSKLLTISRDGGRVAQGRLDTAAGRAIIAQFFAEYMKEDLRGPPRVVHAEGRSLTDMDTKCVHIINLASLGDLERALSQPLNPVRFRANFVVDTGVPWSEWQWVGRNLKAGDVELEVFARTERCAATNVNPRTGERDRDIPAKLLRRWGHADFGVYARIIRGGNIASGAQFELV